MNPWTTFAVAFMLATPAHAGDTEIVRLKVGREVVGEVLDFQESVGVEIARAGDGSVLFVRWDQMHPDDVRRIRASRGFLSDEAEPIFVEATRIVLTSGHEMVGRIRDDNGDTFVLFDGQNRVPLRWVGVRRRETIQVNALDVYGAEELYGEKLYSEPPETAHDHYNIALYCESLQYWERAKEHLEACRDTDPDFKASLVSNKLKRAELRLSSAAETAILDKASRLAHAERFNDALAMVGAFIDDEANRNSTMLGEFRKEQTRLERMRSKWLGQKVVANFFAYLDRAALKIARDREIAINEAQKQIELEATKMVLETLAEKFGASIEEVQAIWEDPDRSRASNRTSSYGGGTFILGPDRALEGMVKEDKRAKPGEQKAEGGAQSGGGGGGNALEDRIRDMIERRNKEKEERKKRGPRRKSKVKMYDVPPNKDEWWTTVASVPERKNFLLAYWAERDPHVKLLSPIPHTCVRCQGQGVLLSASQGSRDAKQPCDRCKGLRLERKVKFN